MSYRINVIGAGPAGLFSAASIKILLPSADVQIFERNPKESLSTGLGYTFIPQTLSYLQHFGGKFIDDITRDNPRWNTVSILSESGMMTQRISAHNYVGIPRKKLMHALDNLVAGLEIPTTYNAEITNENISDFTKTDLTIIATGVKRFLSPEAARPFTIFETESPMHYAWFEFPITVSDLSVSIDRTTSVPYLMHAYPFAKDTSAFVVEVLGQNVAAFCNEFGFDQQKTKKAFLTPDLFSQARLRGSQRPLHENMLLLGDAGCTPYFHTGAGLNTAFYVAHNLAKAIATPAKTLPERLTLFAATQGDYYHKMFTQSVDLLNRNLRVLQTFDSLDESDRVLLVTGKGLDGMATSPTIKL